MSDFDSIDDLTLTVAKRSDKDFIIDMHAGGLTSRTIANDHAPALALAILEAAGIKARAHDGYASTEHDKVLEDAAWEIRRVANARAAEAREAEAAAARDERRDELARELSVTGVSYADSLTGFQRAIDRIIELEARA